MNPPGRPAARICEGVGFGTGPTLAGIPGRLASRPSGSMNCRTFRKLHVDFVDGLLNDERSASLYEHRDRCNRCAQLDTMVRRGLLVARNLPQIQPSPDFMPRLRTRLRNPESRPTSRVGARTTRIMMELGAAVAVASGVVFALHQRWGQTPSETPLHAAVVVEAKAAPEIRGHLDSERMSGDSTLSEALKTMGPVPFPGVPEANVVGASQVGAALRVRSALP